jgi:hypothetical protein
VDGPRLLETGWRGMLRGMFGLADVARFRPSDPDELVNASLACPLCLGSDQVQWQGALEGHDPSVRCSCPECGEHWLVYLAPEQALRIGLLS